MRDAPEKGGKAMFADQDFQRGEVLFVMGGRAVTRETINAFESGKDFAAHVQRAIDESLLASLLAKPF